MSVSTVGAHPQPSASSSRSQRASSRSVLARRLRPRNARVSTRSARCATAPAATSASQTNSQPVHASTATLHLTPTKTSRPPRHGRRRRVDPAPHHLPRIGVQRVEGDLRSMHIKPGYDRHQGLLYSSGFATTRESLAPSGGGPSSCHLCANCSSEGVRARCLFVVPCASAYRFVRVRTSSSRAARCLSLRAALRGRVRAQSPPPPVGGPLPRSLHMQRECPTVAVV